MRRAGRGRRSRLAVIGRPNVGKSSLVNAFLGAERVIVSEHGGDDPRLDRHAARGRRPRRGAGRHRRASGGGRKVAGTVDYYAQLRSERAAERADVALVVCDATEGVTAEDLRVAELAMKTGCATLIALNKWDLREPDTGPIVRAGGREGARIAKRVRQRPPVIACSALTGRGVAKLLDTRDRRSPTGAPSGSRRRS